MFGVWFAEHFVSGLDGNCESGQQDLLEEIKMMKRVGSHPYIVNMLGCVTQSVPLMLLVEFVSGGDLLTYLRQLRPEVYKLHKYCCDFRTLLSNGNCV